MHGRAGAARSQSEAHPLTHPTTTGFNAISASTFDTLATARAAVLVLACLVVTGCATMESGSRIGTIDRVTPLHAAAFAAQVPLIEALLADGARVNARAENAVTPLHVAAAYGHVRVIKALLAAGANVKLHNGITPLHEAALAGHPAAVEALLAAGPAPTRPRTAARGRCTSPVRAWPRPKIPPCRTWKRSGF